MLYLSDQEEDERYELFSVPLAGGAPRKLSAPLVAGGDVHSFRLSPDRRWFVYAAGQAVNGDYELFSGQVAGSEPARKLDAPSPILPYTYEPSRDSAHVLFRVGESAPSPLFSAPLDGSRPATRVDREEAASGAYLESLDGQRVVYASSVPPALYSAPLDGSSEPVNLAASLPPGTNVVAPAWIPGSYWLSADEVVFLAGENSSQLDLYRAELTGGETRRIVNGPLGRHWPPAAPAAPATAANPMLVERDEGLLALELAPGVRATTLVAHSFGRRPGAVKAFEIAPDGARVVYRADEDSRYRTELYSVRPAERREHVQLSPELENTVESQRLDPTGRRVVFVGYPSLFDRALFSAPADGRAAAVRLSPNPPSGQIEPSFEITADGARVLYRSGPDEDAAYALWSVPIDGSAAPSLLCSAASGLRVTPNVRSNGSDALFLARQAGTPRVELYRAALDGSAPPQRLSQEFSNGAGTVDPDFQPSPDGRWVVFRANAERSSVYELFAVPSDGGREPVRLSAPLANRTAVRAFAVDARSRCVVYRADQDVRGRFELYSVLLDGSGAPRRLNRELVDNGDVGSFRLSPEGDWVVYEADQREDAMPELFRAPIDARAPALSLSGPLVAGGHFERFEFSPDGARLVYLADQKELGLFALYSTALRGPMRARPHAPSGRVVRLSRELVPAGQVADFQVAPDSRSVVFSAMNERYDLTLLRAPIGGEEKAGEILSASIAASGSVVAFRISPEGARVLYLLRGPLTVDLFATELAPSPAAKPRR